MGTVTLKPRLGEGRYATIDSSIISLSRIKYIKGCFGLTYVSQHKSLQPCLSIQKKFKPLQFKKPTQKNNNNAKILKEN
ncbi:hypothetical protein BFP75_06665 [Maribacter sp. 4G9]|nr:hypothetical protein BFP75_06665 [Maribacter sp. 4G9]